MYKYAVERQRIGHAHAVRKPRLMPLGCQLLGQLRAKAMHQHDAHAHALNQRQIGHDAAQLARRNGLALHAHHKRLAPVHVNVERHSAKPRDKSRIEYSRKHDSQRRARKKEGANYAAARAGFSAWPGTGKRD